MTNIIKFFVLFATLYSIPSFAGKPYPQCDHLRPLISWFNNLDCKKVPDYKPALQYLPEEDAVLFKIGKEIPLIQGSWKNEFRDSIKPALNSRYTYHLETKFYKDGVPKRDLSIVVAQWHDRKANYETFSTEIKERANRARPPLTIRVINHKLYVILWNDKIFDEKGGVGNGEILYVQDINFGDWYTFDFEAKWSAEESGYFKFYIDGRLVLNYKGAIGYKLDSVGPYFKFGFYTVHPFEEFGYMQIAHRNYSRLQLK